MERSDTHNEYTPPCVYNVEQLALQALVDRLFADSDARVFQIFNKMILKEKES